MKKLLLLFLLSIPVFVSSSAFGAIVDTLPQDNTSSSMMIQETSSENSSSGFDFIGLITPIFIYLFFSYCLYLLATKLGEQYAWLAFIPVFSLILNLRMARMSAWWILGLFIPLFNIYVVIKMMHQGISLRTGHGGGWTAGLFFLYMIFLPITAFTYQSNSTPLQSA